MDLLSQEENPGADWRQIVPFLDECLAQLNEKDRQAVLLRFFEQKSFSEIGALLGTNPGAATKRAERAVEKLRHLFHKRGVVLSAAGLAALYPGKIVWEKNRNLIGNSGVMHALASGADAGPAGRAGIGEFLKVRERYLIYP